MSEPSEVKPLEEEETIEALRLMGMMADEIKNVICNLNNSNISLKLTLFVRLSSAMRLVEQSGHDVTFLRHVLKGIEEVVKKELGEETGQEQIQKLIEQEEEISKVLQLVQEILDCTPPSQENFLTVMN